MRSLTEAAPVFAALGDATRLAVVARLCTDGPLSISRLSESVAVSRQAVTKHLETLAEATGDRASQTGGVALATMKRDRFASLETGIPDSAPCRVITRPFVVRHPRLYVNAATWGKGSIQVEALTRDWQPIPGFAQPEAREIQGDALDHPVRWSNQADLGPLVGREIRLKFYMTRARLHAMTLSHAERPLAEVEGEYRADSEGDSTPKLN